MRSVQVVDDSSQTTRAKHVIGIDESGNVTQNSPSTLAVVRCPRERGERLAELLIQHELAPWRGKWSSLGQHVSSEERTDRVLDLLDSLRSESIPWRATVVYPDVSIHEKAAAVCILAKKTITPYPEFSQDSVLLPDGASDMYGSKQHHLRTQAAHAFDGSFRSAFGDVYVSALSNADLTYPEVATADLIAGCIRELVVQEDRSVSSLPDEVIRFRTSWREPEISPLPFHSVRGISGDYGEPTATRIAAWIKGRHPDGGRHDVSSQLNNTIRILESDSVRQYLTEQLEP